MTRYDIEGYGVLILFLIACVAAFAFGGYTIAAMVYQADAKSDCLARGYPEARTDWKFNSYCVSYDFRTTVRK